MLLFIAPVIPNYYFRVLAMLLVLILFVQNQQHNIPSFNFLVNMLLTAVHILLTHASTCNHNNCSFIPSARVVMLLSFNI